MISFMGKNMLKAVPINPIMRIGDSRTFIPPIPIVNISPSPTITDIGNKILTGII